MADDVPSGHGRSRERHQRAADGPRASAGGRLAPAGGPLAPGVRAEIAVSWDRSVSRGLRPDHVEAPYEVDLDLGGRFARAAGPVADQLSDDLAGTGVALLLADERARLIDRRVSDPEFLARLDRHMLAPG